MSHTLFYVRVPEGRDPVQAIARADQTINVFAGTFKSPFGTPEAEPDGTFEAIAPDVTASLVRRALQEERLEIVRESSL